MTRGTTQHASRRQRRAAERAERAERPRRRTVGKRPPWWRSRFVLVSTAAAAVAVAVIALSGVPPGGDPGVTVDIEVPTRALPADLVDGQALGKADAAVVLEVYEDYQCPVCGRFSMQYLPALIADFVEPGSLRIVDRPIALLGTGTPDESVEAAVGAVCAARQDRYWAYHDLLMANQQGENRGAFREETLTAMADLARVERTAWDACRADPATRTQVEADTAAAFASGINSTPTFVLNGQRIVGLVAYEDLAGAIAALTPTAVR